MEELLKTCPRCGKSSANKSNPSGRCSGCLKKLASNKKKPGHWQRAQTKADDALRRQDGKNGTASKKSSGRGSRESIVKQTQTAEKKTGQKLSPDRKDNKKGYATKNTRMVPEKLNRGRHTVDKKKLAKWKERMKKADVTPETLKTIVIARLLQTLEKSNKALSGMKFVEAPKGSSFSKGAFGSVKRLSESGSHFLKTGETNKQALETIDSIHKRDHDGKSLGDHTKKHIMEAYPHEHGETTAQREHAYSHLADKFFGMGDHIAKTHHLKSGEVDYGLDPSHPHHKADASVSEVAKGEAVSELADKRLNKKLIKLPAEEAQKLDAYGATHGRNLEYKDILKDHFESGDAHKLSLMDFVLGNWDRHFGNMVAHEDENGKVKIKGIDHGVALHHLDSHPNWGTPPKWILPFVNHNSSEGAKKNFGEWLHGLDPAKLESHIKDLGFNEKAAAAAKTRLEKFKGSIDHYEDPMDAFADAFHMNRGQMQLGDNGDEDALKGNVDSKIANMQTEKA